MVASSITLAKQVIPAQSIAVILDDNQERRFQRLVEETTMKVRASVKKMCRNCKIIRRKGVVRGICTDKRHKQRQG